MTHALELENLVDTTFHSVILEFEPKVPDTYRRCVRTLEDLERRVEASKVTEDAKRSHVVSIRSHLALMASEMEDHVEAERLTANVLELASIDGPGFALAVLIRTKSLHSLGRHEEELAEGYKYAESPGVAGQALLYLLAELAKRHPERMEWRASMLPRVQAYVAESPELRERMQSLRISEQNLNDYILAVHEIDRQITREKTARILGEA